MNDDTAKRFMTRLTPLTRSHGHMSPCNSSLRLSQDYVCEFLDVPALLAISLEKAHSRGFLLYIVFVEHFCL